MREVARRALLLCILISYVTSYVAIARRALILCILISYVTSYVAIPLVSDM
jgi:antibiotic biosynthesis monooxygenase (ABM) superfamily enzyme